MPSAGAVPLPDSGARMAGNTATDECATGRGKGVSASPKQVGVLIVGAGFSGLGAAIRLEKAGRHDFLVIDRGPEGGGTWRDNTYPGAACDVPSHLYSYSFAMNPDWSRMYSPQREIQEYFRRTAQRSGTLDRQWFNCELLSARWDTNARHWIAVTSRGIITATILVTAFGGLSEPKLPNISGIADYSGQWFHTAGWNHDCELAGKRVAIIGTCASAIQVIPEIAVTAGHLDIYQRTAPWVMPRGDRAHKKVERLAFRRVPGYQRLVRVAIFARRDINSLAFCYAPSILSWASRPATRHLAQQVDDPDLRRRLTPDFVMGCKRVLLSDDYYPALTRKNVDLITDPIARIECGGIVTADGTVRKVDVLIVATGFHATDSPAAELVVGAHGRSLAQQWRDAGPQAYKGSTVAGFPNMFMLVGPNTGTGTTSMIYMIESQLNYLIDALRVMDRFNLATVDVHSEVMDRYNAAVQRRMAKTVWASGCTSWYLDSGGRNRTLWPSFGMAFRAATRRFDLHAYRITPRRSESTALQTKARVLSW